MEKPNITSEEIKQIIHKKFPNLKGDSAFEKVTYMKQALIKESNFTEFHLKIQSIIKELVSRKDYPKVSTRAKGYEGIWITAIALYLKKL